MSRIDRWLEQLPESNDSPTCPWYEAIMVCGLTALLLGYAGRPYGLVPAVVAVTVMVIETAHRKRNPSC